KLTLSYIFIGFVPVLLIVVFFLLCGLLLFFNVSSYLVQSRVEALVDETRFLAEASAIELARTSDDTTFDEVLTRRQEAASARYQGASMVVVPTMRLCGPANATPGRTVSRPLESGAWAHLNAPTTLPDWVTCEGFAGLIAYQAPPLGAAAIRESPLWRTHLVVRAVAFPAEAVPRYAVIIDVPVTAATGLQIQNDTGIELGDISTLGMTATDVKPAMGPPIEEDSTDAATRDALPPLTLLHHTHYLTAHS